MMQEAMAVVGFELEVRACLSSRKVSTGRGDGHERGDGAEGAVHLVVFIEGTIVVWLSGAGCG